MKDFDYQHWLATASRHARRAGEAPDLLHDAILDAIRADRTDFSVEANRRWFTGVLRNRAAMTARSAVRRRGRETVASKATRHQASTAAPSDEFLRTLPASARSVATLVVSGLDKKEIVAALRLTDTTFRQRLTTIRKAWQKLPDAELEAADETQGVDSDLAVGFMRRALLRHVCQLGGVGTHDPDGHLIVLDGPHPKKL